MSTITLPRSLFLDGQWHDANWSAEIIDDDSGEILLIAALPGSHSDPANIVALSLTSSSVRRLRILAGFDDAPAPQPIDAHIDARLSPLLDWLTDHEQRIGNLQRAALPARIDAAWKIGVNSLIAEHGKRLRELAARLDALEQRIDDAEAAADEAYYASTPHGLAHHGAAS